MYTFIEKPKIVATIPPEENKSAKKNKGQIVGVISPKKMYVVFDTMQLGLYTVGIDDMKRCWMSDERQIEYMNTISHMDALDLCDCLEDDSIDMILTSPPYDNLRTYTDGFAFDFGAIARQSYRVLKPGGVLVWVVGDATIDGSETLTSMRQALYFVDVAGFKMHDTMIYHNNPRHPEANRYYQAWEFMFVLSKNKPKASNLQTRSNRTLGANNYAHRRYANGKIKPIENMVIKTKGVMPNVWKINAGYMQTTKDKEAYAHPAMFPEKLAERHILTWSNPGDVVMDYFMGSGTTAKMARNNGRHYIGCDISAEYVQIARSRLAKPYTLPMFDEQPKQEASPVQAEMEL